VTDIVDRLYRAVLGSINDVSKRRYLHSNNPIEFHLKIISDNERGYSMPSNGLVVSIYKSMSVMYDHNFYEQDMIEIKQIITERLYDASTKFSSYHDSLKIVLLEFYGEIDELPEETIRELVGDIELPQLIDEVWSVRQEWVSDDETEPVYERLR
jgi:hypothetical protein